MSDNIASVIAKVQKLLSLAGNNTNENECKAARAAADRIISEHRLTMADIEVKGGESEPFVSKRVSQGGRRLGWKETILHALCKTYGGAFFFTSYRTGGCGGRGGGEGGKGVQYYTVVAQESDAAIIEYMLSYLSGEVDRLARWHCGGNGIAASNGFRAGCAAGIASQFADLRAATRVAAEASGQSTALVLLDKRAELAKERMNAEHELKTGAAIGSTSDRNARNLGYSEGRKVQIKNGIGTSSVPKLA